jgi:sarcosine oxidase subunit gamma
METGMNAMTAAGVTIAELAPTTRVSLRIADPAAVSGLALPRGIGVRAEEGRLTALCLGPDEWLVEGSEAEVDALVGGITAPCSAVEVSDREITLALEGAGVLDLLAAGCPRDVARMPVGSGARTVFDSAQVVLTREAEDRFHLTVWRSFAPHVRAILELALRERSAGL